MYTRIEKNKSRLDALFGIDLVLICQVTYTAYLLILLQCDP